MPETLLVPIDSEEGSRNLIGRTTIAIPVGSLLGLVPDKKGRLTLHVFGSDANLDETLDWLRTLPHHPTAADAALHNHTEAS